MMLLLLTLYYSFCVAFRTIKREEMFFCRRSTIDCWYRMDLIQVIVLGFPCLNWECIHMIGRLCGLVLRWYSLTM
ncbi:hypothetical protein KC19_12G113900 [Ceratodon purpureus]|uniref:Uncharacterized protein n=1 Tax=Ceratodon purpureus TaxID=3225 RepID=A0A8T0G618_CERPU|nr:hypothetical protein KC19_12G113900 [Ceratodon purpureus]